MTADTSSTVSLTVNGVQHEVEVDHRTSLLDLLRERLDLTGTKKGCDAGACGACTVNGQRHPRQCLPHPGGPTAGRRGHHR